MNCLPPGTFPLENQVAGHAFNDCESRTGMLVHKDGYVMKPTEGPTRGKREIAFYEDLKMAVDSLSKELKTFVPEFYGASSFSLNGQEVEYIMLSNTTLGMAQPCVMDIKIGKQTWDPEATQEKKIKEQNKYAESKSEFGFCIPGLQVYNSVSGELTKYGKDFGKTLTREKTKEVFHIFMNLQADQGRPVLKFFLSRLRQLLDWCLRQRKYLFYSSSLLLAYDVKSIQSSKQPMIATINMIDFAHVFPSMGNADLNYIEGIQSLVKLFEDL